MALLSFWLIEADKMHNYWLFMILGYAVDVFCGAGIGAFSIVMLDIRLYCFVVERI